MVFPNELKLKDVCRKIGSGATPRGGNKVYLENGPTSLIRSQNIYNDGFHKSGLAFISQKHADHLLNVVVEAEDILLNITGDSVARCCMVNETILPARVNQHVAIIRPNRKQLNPAYLHYVLISPKMQAQLLSWAGSGGTRNALTKAMIENIKIPDPGLSVQKAIAHILGAFDDKIDLNRRMNEILEAMARAIFKSWFVDFDGCTEFQDSELGPIPKGWAIVPFSDTIKIYGGGTPKTKVDEYWNGDIPWFSVVDAPTPTDVFVLDTQKHISEVGLSNSSTRLLPKLTTIVSARGTVGRLALTAVPMAMNQSCYGLSGADGASPFFTYFSTKRLISELQKRTHGSVFDTITRNTFKTIKIAVPPREKAIRFERSVAPFMEKILANLRPSTTSAKLRDTLLPRLISGELQVNDGERIMGGTPDG